MALDLDNAALRKLGTPRNLALHFLYLSKKHSAKTITDHLLNSVEHGALPPSFFAVWLLVCDSPETLAAALWQSHSRYIRAKATTLLGKYLQRSSWHLWWDALGGIQGLLSLFAQLSVLEVKDLCKAIGHCAKLPEVDHEEKRQQVTQLLKGLLPAYYPDSPSKTPDSRPLERYYAQIVPACTSDFVGTVLRQEVPPLLGSLPWQRVVRYHYPLISRLAVEATLQSGQHREENSKDQDSDPICTHCLPSLLQSIPSSPGEERGFSASMSFSTRVLNEVTNQKRTSFPEGRFLPDLMDPLMRRAMRRSISMIRLRQIVEIALQYLEAHRDEVFLLLGKDSFSHYVLKCWSKKPDLFENQLIAVLGMQDFDISKDFSQCESIFRSMKKEMRYRLIRLFFLHSRNLGFDIDEDEGLDDLTIEKWPPIVFQILDQDHAVSLLQGLIRLKPSQDFLKLNDSYSILGHHNELYHPSGPWPDSGDPVLLLALLGCGGELAVNEAARSVEAKKKKAIQSREQSDRGFFAKWAILHAISSGSLDLYGEVVLWSRRFLRDPLTAKEIYSRRVTNTCEGVALLSGIPENTAGLTAAQIKSRVSKANEIILGFLDSATMALRAPSFKAYDWDGPLALFFDVVESRMSRESKLKRILNISEEELYDILWADSLRMLLQAEQVALEPGYRNLDFNGPNGPLFCSRKTLKAVSPLSCRFLDDLAKARDELWQKVRPKGYPASAVQRPPFPRGLPIQNLVFLKEDAQDENSSHMPYIASRAIALVFCEPKIALSPIPKDTETRQALRGFVDHYETALWIYVMQSSSPREREERVSRAWSYALTTLSSERMSEYEAGLFWKPIFERTLPHVKLPIVEKQSVEYPVLPSDVDVDENTEWNPTNGKPDNVEPRTLQPVALDCMLTMHSCLRWLEHDLFKDPEPSTQALAFPQIFSWEMLCALPKLGYTVKEGLIVSALLFLSNKTVEHSRLLSSPFPVQNDARYPAIFLDQDFFDHEIAESGQENEGRAQEIVDGLLKDIPPTLLQSAANAALQVPSTTPSSPPDVSSREQIGYKLLSSLASSDRPQAASRLVLQTVLDRPDASSWHRYLLTNGFLRSLATRDAEALLRGFASSIFSKLEERTRHFAQVSAENSSADDDSVAPSKPFIKITTVKYLAQILHGTDAIPPSLSTELLSKLFQASSQVDIRTAVIDSMLQRLAECVDETSKRLAERVIEALETTIPVLGSLSERDPRQEARLPDTLPELYDNGITLALPPMLDLVINAVATGHVKSKRMREEVVKKILLPTIELSTRNNARWVEVFVSMHSPDGPPISIPSFPVKPHLLCRLLSSCPELVPAHLLDLYHQFILINIRPSPAVAALKQTIANNSSLRSSDSCEHWLWLYGQGTSILQHTDFNLASLLLRPTSPPSSNSIAHIQSLVHAQALALLHSSTDSTDPFDTFVSALEPPLELPHSQQAQKAWIEHAKPLIPLLIREIKSLRSLDWQKDPNRSPPVLPDTLRYRLWLLPYPCLDTTASLEQRCERFAGELGGMLEELEALGVAYHGALKEILAAALRCDSEKEKVLVACTLGTNRDATSWGPLAMLSVEIAEALFRKAAFKTEEDKGRCREVVESWIACQNEEVRVRGIRFKKDFEKLWKVRGEGNSDDNLSSL